MASRRPVGSESCLILQIVRRWRLYPNATLFVKTGRDHRMSRIDRIKRTVTAPHAPTPRFFIPSIRAILVILSKNRQRQAPKALTPSVAKNAFRDRLRQATAVTPRLTSQPDVEETDCARGGQQHSVGPLGQHGRHGPLAKTSPFSLLPARTRPCQFQSPIALPIAAAPNVDERATTSLRAAGACRGTPRSSPGSGD